MRLCFIAMVLGFVVSAIRVRAQTAEVVLYSHGSWASELHPYSRNGIFTGGVWDGDEPLLLFVDRPFKVNNRFIVLSMPAGLHVLGTGEGRHPRKGSQLPLTLEAGQRYFVRARVKSDALNSAVEFLEVVPCATAQGELADAKALDPRAVQQDRRTWVKPDQAIAPCP